MKIQRLSGRGNAAPDGAKSRFGGVWEVELDAGEQTQAHLHEDLEEIYCFVEGAGDMVIAQRKRPVVRGEVIHIPRLTSHWLENSSESRMRCLAIESPVPGAPRDLEKPAARETVGALEKLICDMPADMDQVAAIKQIVGLFDVAGRLSEQIEEAFGLDNDEGTAALGRIEKKIMDAVVEITRRYQKRSGRELGGFGGRLNLS